jgi:anti-sigma B factor antagonist
MLDENLQLEGDAAIVSIDGPFRGRNAAVVRNKLIECIKNGYHKIVVDFTNVPDINATGLGVLVSVQRRLDSIDGKLNVRGLNTAVTAIFQRTRLDRSFRL